MNLIIDTNIIISSLITPRSNLSKLIFHDLVGSRIIAPSFMFEEILNKYDKLLRSTKLTDEQLKELIYLLLKRVDFIDNDLISSKNQQLAYELVKDIDPKDLLFVALSIQTGFKIWTGDLKLHQGLKKKGFTNIISTKDLVKELK